MAKLKLERHPEILQSAGLTLAEWYVLSLIGTWPVPEPEIARTTANLSHGDPRGAINARQALQAYKRCLRSHCVTVVTDAYLSLLKLFLDRDPALGPVCGLPQPGEVDFLPPGARLFLDLRARIFPDYQAGLHFPTQEPQPGLIFLRKQDLRRYLEQTRKREPGLKPEEARAVGRWRRYWWDEYDHGFFVPTPGQVAS